ncbi:hypothetical protein MIND_01377300 [Mycena indigotica]|uniref:BTB/POZ domain-containing protein n=1 Tax=Mycena indigotica TaxID=2126181 RepID=A0A8H6RYE5_9AGAR|nr:uncharacterized protein MIND_01377300 [Mycena indigotica]KAF7289162.1 hypothetical protein MIND_01377300 [Mycena indigotica]
MASRQAAYTSLHTVEDVKKRVESTRDARFQVDCASNTSSLVNMIPPAVNGGVKRKREELEDESGGSELVRYAPRPRTGQHGWGSWRPSRFWSCRERTEPPQRHPRFFGEKNIVIRVGSMVYEVPQHILAPDYETTTFSRRLNEPATEDSPLVLSPEDACGLDAFLELEYDKRKCDNKRTPADLETFMQAYKFAHAHQIQNRPADALPHDQFPPQLCVKLLRFLQGIQLFNEFGVQKQLERRLEATLVDYVADDTILLPQAVEIAESNGFRRLLGEVYYVTLCKLTKTQPADTILTPIRFNTNGLDAIDERRLRNGHFSLTACGQRVAQELREHSCPPRYANAPVARCRCLLGGQEWLAALLSSGPDLRAFLDWAERNGANAPRECVEMLTKLREELDCTLTDHFIVS